MQTDVRGALGPGPSDLAPLVDAHAHIWSAAMPIVRNAWTRPTYAFPVEDYLATLDAHGIGFGVIAAASLFGTYNDYTIASLRRHRRLRGTAIVDPRIDFYTLEHMRMDGIVGVRLQLYKLPLPDFADDDFVRLLFRLRDLDMHVHVNIEGDRLPAVLDALAPSGVKVVVDHMGWPDPALGADDPHFQTLLRKADGERVWVKLSAGYRYDDPGPPAAWAHALIAAFGPERLFWASDAPFVGHEGQVTYTDTVRHFAEWAPDPRLRRTMGEAAYRFYFE
jgi:predicted TIM-barrel fold metal-dependent hydrolase